MALTRDFIVFLRNGRWSRVGDRYSKITLKVKAVSVVQAVFYAWNMQWKINEDSVGIDGMYNRDIEILNWDDL